MSKLLSICIPTKDRIQIIKKTLESIYSQTNEFSEFEVIISDNSKNDELSILLNKDFKYPNIVYQKSDSVGFLNSINVLGMGSGSFLKLNNDYSMFKDGSLDLMLKLIKLNINQKPLIFFGNGLFRNTQDKMFSSFESFLYDISYWSTWSSSFGIWKNDFDKVKVENFNPIFPHTSLLLNLTDKKKYLLNDIAFYDHQKIDKKGGYNLFKGFAVDYLDMLKVCLQNNEISENTFKHIKRDMFKNFLVEWYCNTMILKNNYTYILSDIKQSMNVHYSNSSYYTLVLLAYSKAFIHGFKNFITKTFNMQKRRLK